MAYTSPTPTELKTKYPIFMAVADDTIKSWLGEAALECSAFPEEVRANAEMLWSASKMMSNDIGQASIAGVTSFRSVDFSANISETVAGRIGFEANSYGQDFLALRRRYFGSPMLIGPGYV